MADPRGTGNEVLDNLQSGWRNQVNALDQMLSSMLITGREDPSVYENLRGRLRSMGYNPEDVLPVQIQKELMAGDAVIVGYNDEAEIDKAIEMGKKYGVEISADLPHVWRKPNRLTIRPSADEKWDADRLKKYAMQRMIFPDRSES